MARVCKMTSGRAIQVGKMKSRNDIHGIFKRRGDRHNCQRKGLGRLIHFQDNADHEFFSHGIKKESHGIAGVAR